jgi:glutamyl-tRNA reductase
MTLHVLGVSHRTAGPETRAALSLSPDQIGQLLERVAAAGGLEAVVLDTCNRTELYVAGTEAVPQVREVLRGLCPAAPRLDSESWYQLDGAAAFRHLLRVACGLDSAVLGDDQIVAQLRRALSTSQGAGALGAVLSPSVGAALRLGRHVRAATDLGSGAPGVGSVVTHAVGSHGVPTSGRVLVLGAAEAGRAVLRNLKKAGYRDLVVANRRAERAVLLAAELDVTPAAWEDVAELLVTVDAVVVATGARTATLTTLPARTAPLLVVDAGFPPQVHASVARPGVEVLSLAGLQAQTDAAALARLAAVPAVESLVEREVASWQAAQDRAPIEAAIKRLHLEADRLTREAVVALAGRVPLSPQELEHRLQREVKVMLHRHATRLRSLPPRPRAGS